MDNQHWLSTVSKNTSSSTVRLSGYCIREQLLEEGEYTQITSILLVATIGLKGVLVVS